VRPRVGTALSEISLPIIIVGIWWLWSREARSFYFPPLAQIVGSFLDTCILERVSSDLVPTLRRLGVGYGIAGVMGVGGGIVLGLAGRLRLAASPVVEFFRSVPPPALVPFGIVLFGIGDGMKIFLIALACVWPILLNTRDGIIGVDPVILETASVYRLSRFERLRFVLLPAVLPQVFAGMRTSLSLAVILAVISEMVAGTNGVGFFLLQSQRSFAIPEMWSAILLLGLLGSALNAAFTLVERRVLRWHRSARAAEL
jgi:ABC-type nitrate/sulfonate/bicarbonate transport system permease component